MFKKLKTIIYIEESTTIDDDFSTNLIYRKDAIELKKELMSFFSKVCKLSNLYHPSTM